MKTWLPVPLILLLLTACSGQEETRTIVASVYPLAYAAERVAGPGWEVIDLTPPGTEAHDLELSLEQRAELEEATVVMYLGRIGFQPQVEKAILDSEGDVAGAALHLGGARRDPHWWLDPGLYESAVDFSNEILSREAPEETSDYENRASRMTIELESLEARFEQRLSDCRYGTAIVTHEAFGYLADRFGFQQVGLAGVTPEAEPSAARLARARELVDEGAAGAVFYEGHEDAREIAESFAADAGVPALPLSSLESEPAKGDYFTVMEDNLESLREGLQCR